MYNKVVIFVCAVAVTSAGNLLRAAPLPQDGPIGIQLVDIDDTNSYAIPPSITYASAPTPYTQTYVASAISPLNTKAQSSPLSYAPAVPIVSYSAPVAETIVPASYSNIGHSILYSGGPSVTQNYGVPAQNTYAVAPIQAPIKSENGDGDDEDEEEENDTDKEGEGESESENDSDSDSECDSESEEDDD